jgi:hypothetical protein
MLKLMQLLIMLILILITEQIQLHSVSVIRQCGRENQILPDIQFTGVIETRDHQLHYTQVYQNNEALILAHDDQPIVMTPLNPLEVRSPQLLQLKDGSLVYLSFIAEDNQDVPYTLHVLRADGKHLTLPPDYENALFVERLVAEVRPNVLTVLINGEGTAVYQAEVNITATSVAIAEIQLLPFEYHSNSGPGLYLEVAPNHNYIFHTEIFKNLYVIYDLEQHQIVWEYPSTNGLPSIVWTNNEDLIAIVSFDLGRLSAVSGQALGIYQDGRSELLLDIESIYGEQHFISFGVPVAGDQVAMWVSQPQIDQVIDDQLVLLNYRTGEVIDLCITANQSRLYADASGEYLLFNTSPTATETRLMLVSTETGDYRYFTSEELLSIIPNTFEIVR